VSAEDVSAREVTGAGAAESEFRSAGRHEDAIASTTKSKSRHGKRRAGSIFISLSLSLDAVFLTKKLKSQL
jgi:hypothetical protein